MINPYGIKPQRGFLRTADCIDGILRELTVEHATFFDTIRAEWKRLFPDSPARPGRWNNGTLCLYVGNAGLLFAFRPKLKAVREKLAALPDAPRNLKVTLEAHSAAFTHPFSHSLLPNPHSLLPTP